MVARAGCIELWFFSCGLQESHSSECMEVYSVIWESMEAVDVGIAFPLRRMSTLF